MDAFVRRMLGAVLLVAGSAHAQTWQDTLRARDVNRDGTIDAYYDTSLDITWLADWHTNDGTYEPHTWTPEAGEWGFAMIRAGAFVLHGATDWRLPTLRPADGDSSYSRTSELSLLFNTLGLVPEDIASRNDCYIGCGWQTPFSGITPWDSYWTNVSFPITGAPDFGVTPLGAYTFEFLTGRAGTLPNWNPGVATFVHEGDVFTTVSAIPEPSTYALMAIGLLGVAGAARRRQRALHAGGSVPRGSC